MIKIGKLIWKFLCWFDSFIPTLGIFVMGFSLALQIFMRYIVGRPLTWSDELARYAYVWVCFAGLSYCCRNHTNIRMEAVLKILPLTVRKVVIIALNLLSIAVFSYLLPFAVSLARSQFSAKSSAMRIPRGFISISVPIGFSLLIINLIVQTFMIFRTPAEKVVVSGSH